VDKNIHFTACDDQPEGFPCICDHIKDQYEELELDQKENEFTQ